MDNLSTRQVAELLGVSPATIKRWANSSPIPYERTVGKHRRFRVDDIAAFVRSTAYNVAAANESSLGERVERGFPLKPGATARFRDGLLAGRAATLLTEVAHARLAGLSLPRLMDEIVAPALADIHDRRMRGVLSEVHGVVARRTLQRVLERVRVQTVPRGEWNGRALFVGDDDDRSDASVTMARLVAYAHGLRVETVAAATLPSKSLSRSRASMIVLFPADALAQSKYARLVEPLTLTATRRNVPIAVYGVERRRVEFGGLETLTTFAALTEWMRDGSEPVVSVLRPSH